MTVQIEHIENDLQADFCEVTLENGNGVRLVLLNLGACIERIELPTKSGYQNVVLSLPSPESYLQNRTYFGSTVGRVAGRLPTDQWRHGSENIQLDNNDRRRHKHGGNEGLDRCFFNLQRVGNQRVVFSYLDPDGHNGYPGNLATTVTYTLDDTDALTCLITGVTDQMTLFNPTNHTYFTLDGPGSDILHDSIMVAADYYQPLTKELTPSHGWVSVDKSPFDLQTHPSLSNVLSSSDAQVRLVDGLNHAFLLNQSAPLAVTLSSPINHRQIDMITDAPAVIIYSGNHFQTNTGNQVPKYGGITMEAQVAPEANDDWSDITLMPGITFKRNITWHFSY